MWKFEHYDDVQGLWDDMNEAIEGIEFSPVPREHFMRRLEKTQDGLSARITKGYFGGPTAVRVSVAPPEGGNNLVTKLDFRDISDPYGKVSQYVGHLLLPPAIGQKAHGLHIVTMADIPPEAAPHVASLEQGLDLLLPR